MRNYEDVLVLMMLHEEIIKGNYKSIQKLAKIVKWDNIRKEFKIKKKFKAIVKHIINLGLIDDHGKSANVASLSDDGILYANSIREGYDLSWIIKQ